MRTSLRYGAFVLALLGSVSLVGAQDKAGDVGQNPGAQTPSGAIPPDNTAQGSGPGQAQGAVPPETAGTAKEGGPAATDRGEAMIPGGPPGATGQTMPSTRSAENAAEDKRIIVEHGLNLSNEQKQKIAQLMASQMGGGTTSSGSGDSEGLTVGNTVPATVTMSEFPQSVNDQMPEMQNYKYVQMPDKLLIVEPNNRIVISAINR
jgi:hypothetical protein